MQLGFDVGGSNIALGAVDDNFKIIERVSLPFPTGEHYENITAIMASMARDVAAKLNITVEDFSSIGIAVPGSIDRQFENVVHAYNLQFHNVPLRKSLQDHFPSVPVFLANDADAAALAELYAGAFVGTKTAVLLTLGTGVGGGIIINGRMFSGGMNNGIEPGHMPLVLGGPMCTCGIRGCIESVCTATWLVQQGRKSVVEYPKCMIYTSAKGNMDNVDAKMVMDCAKAGDKIAKDIFDQYIIYLGSALIGFYNLLDPEVVALGGGVSNAGEFLFEPVREYVKKHAFFEEIGNIVPAQMGNDAGIVGAAMLSRNFNV